MKENVNNSQIDMKFFLTSDIKKNMKCTYTVKLRDTIFVAPRITKLYWYMYISFNLTTDTELRGV